MLIQNFLQQEAGAFGNNIGKEQQKPRPKLKNVYIIYWEYLLCLQCNASGSFFQTCITFVEKRLKFSPLKKISKHKTIIW